MLVLVVRRDSSRLVVGVSLRGRRLGLVRHRGVCLVATVVGLLRVLRLLVLLVGVMGHRRWLLVMVGLLRVLRLLVLLVGVMGRRRLLLLICLGSRGLVGLRRLLLGGRRPVRGWVVVLCGRMSR